MASQANGGVYMAHGRSLFPVFVPDVLPITVRFASVTNLLLDESVILAVVVVSAFTTLDNPTSVFVTLCGFPVVSCEWSYAVFPLSHL